MVRPAIEIRHVSKRYRLGSVARLDQTLREAISEGASRLLRRSSNADATATPDPRGELWALRDVNLDVEPGEVVGIIGHNGAGKSTLLKILSRITDPTEGEVLLRGRVGSLLEVGTGFHPELTGRENIFLNGAVLGMSQREVRARFDEIVDFSGVEQFLDTPVKRYSSGMRVRLAFAVAAHLDPEMLIVDEVLAVGDAAFQRKCLGKMRDLSRLDDRTVLFVSHNLDAVQTLCDCAVLLDHGQIVHRGTPDEVVEAYLGRRRAGAADGSDYVKPADQLDTARPIEFLSLQLRPHHAAGQRDIECLVEYVVRRPVGCVLAVVVSTARGVAVTQTIDTDRDPEAFDKQPGHYVARLILPASLLVPDEYRVTLSAADMKSTRFDYLEDVTGFVVPTLSGIHSTVPRRGVLALNTPWHISPAPAAVRSAG